MLRLADADKDGSEGPRSQTSLAYGRLRRDILSGRLKPGEKLKIADLAEALEVSPGAIREALSRLVPESLAVSRDQRGFIVAPLSISDIEDLTDLRCEVETIALRRAVHRGGVEWEAGILAAAHRLRNTRQTADDERILAPEWVDQHAAFHGALVAACGNRRLLDLHARLYEQSERYRGLSAHVREDRDVPAEHQELLDSALARDPERLVFAAVSHMRTTTGLIVAAALKTDTLGATGA
jgi:GntR family carbon starvation induced transcriptional regulator